MSKVRGERRREGRRLVFEGLECRRMLAFGVTTGVAPTGQSTYVIDNGGDLKFSVIRGGNLSSTIHLGDVSSIQYQGQELLAPYSSAFRYAHYESGLSSQTTVSYEIDGDNEWILVTADDSNFGIVQYYAMRNGDNNLYMASDVNAGAQGRFLAYLNRGVFTNIEEPSDISSNVGVVEGSDVFFNSDGTTYSKFYNERTMLEHEVHGVTGTAGSIDVGAWMYMGSREHGAQGPFHTNIDFQTTGGAVEIYNVLFSSGHAAIEPVRYGLMGPYALQFNDGSAPTAPDYDWMAELDLQGWIPDSQRGSLSGVASGMTPGNETVIGLRNSAAQYWAIADPVTGEYSIEDIQAGTYEMTMYDQELEVGTRTVTINPLENLAVDITSTYYTPAATWRIGQWDGTPEGFLNADKIAIMHPSDVRMSPWVNSTFVVGTDTDADWQMAQFREVNNTQVITFNLSPAQTVAAQTLRIGMTLGMGGGRNRIYVNEGQAYGWTSGIPAASAQVGGRSITRGTYRGYNQLYNYNIPASALVAGTNTIRLEVVSGSGGTGFLGPGVVYDAIDLVPTSSLTNAPRLETILLGPTSSRIDVGTELNFAAVGRDQFGNPIAANIDFATTNGTIDQQGHFTAPLTSGAATVTASSGEVSAETLVVIIGPVPAIVEPATASSSVTSGSTVDLSVLGDDNGGEANLTYTWSVLGTPPGAVSFSANGTNAAKNTTVTLGSAGTYDLQVTLEDLDGNTATSQVTLSRREYVARYKADEASGDTLADSSGGENHATLTGAHSFSAGKANNALNLTGGYATLPTGIVSELDDFTIASWVKISSLDMWARVFDFGNDTTNYMFLTPQSNTGRPRFAIRTPSVGEQIVDSSINFPTGTWTHITVSQTGNTVRLYLNGVLRGTNAGVTLRPSSLGETTANYLGESQWPDPALNGSIDDFRIYSRGLSSTEINALATTTPPEAPADLTAMAITNNQIDLSWSAVPGAFSYGVYRGTSSGGPYTQIGMTTETSYQDMNLATGPEGTQFFYAVTAENAGGDSPWSDDASAFVLPPAPAAPVVTAQLADAGELQLSWDPAEFAGSYTIERATISGGPYTTVVSGWAGTSYTDTGLTDHASYFYQVTSENVTGTAVSPEVLGVPTDLRMRLRMDETSGSIAFDSSGQNNDGSLNNDPTWSAEGKLEGALFLDGTNDFVSLPTGVVAGLGEVTISTWVNPAASSDWARIFDFGSSEDVNMFLTPRNGQTGFLRFAITNSGNTSEQQINSTTTLPIGSWSHVAVTISGSVGVLYVNGVEVGRNNAMTLTPSSLGSTTQNYLGRSQYPDPYWRGRVDDFRIYSRALSSVEVAGLTYIPTTPGDYTLDGQVNGADFLAWQRQVGTPASPFGVGADGDVSGRVEATDLVVWSQHYGNPPPSVASANSEPIAASTAMFEAPQFEPTDQALELLDLASWSASKDFLASQSTAELLVEVDDSGSSTAIFAEATQAADQAFSLDCIDEGCAGPQVFNAAIRGRLSARATASLDTELRDQNLMHAWNWLRR